MPHALLALVVTDLRARGISPRTITTYCRIAGHFLESHSDISSISKGSVTDWIYSADTKSKQRHRYLAVNACCRALVSEGLLDSNPCAQVKMPTEAETPQPSLSDEHFSALVRSCDPKSRVGRRDRAIIEVLGSTGCRVAELAAMQLDDIELDQAQILIRSPKKDRHGKARHRLVFLNDSAVSALAAWLHARGSGLRTDSVWINDRYQPLTKTGIQQMLSRRGRRLGIHVSAHQFRRRLATNWLLNGLSETGLMAMGGWRSSTMPSRYASGALAEIARADHSRLSRRDSR